MINTDVLREVGSFLDYHDVHRLRCTHRCDVSARKQAFAHARSLVHRPWVSFGRCVIASCRRIKCLSYMDRDEAVFTLSNYCYRHSSGRRATTIRQAYLMQPQHIIDACGAPAD